MAFKVMVSNVSNENGLIHIRENAHTFSKKYVLFRVNELDLKHWFHWTPTVENAQRANSYRISNISACKRVQP